ncbi:hypothetical protein GRF29_112g334435 [Pseudopithomyces chartarum]|uniref:Uncharacterized protein n=1 Tax=Pseudopithomyces chartarum TaxID=1892770 RepID=A0AAN6LRY2_9PLEO|nr:hypothetical protein GRF29_112g334435 [Pseudopithomyces chartarum]
MAPERAAAAAAAAASAASVCPPSPPGQPSSSLSTAAALRCAALHCSRRSRASGGPASIPRALDWARRPWCLMVPRFMQADERAMSFVLRQIDAPTRARCVADTAG